MSRIILATLLACLTAVMALLAGCASVAPQATAPLPLVVQPPPPALWLLPYFPAPPLPAHFWRLPCAEDPRPGCAEET